jgi:hypothetical protein
MNSEQTPQRVSLDDWMAAGRAAAVEPPAWLEAQLMARFDERRGLQSVRRHAITAARTSQVPSWRRRLAWALALPAAVLAALLVGSVLLWPLPAARPAASHFMALAPLDAIAAERGAMVVPAQVPRAQLAEYGLPVDPARADEPANAELLMSRRGVVLAVRFVQ